MQAAAAHSVAQIDGVNQLPSNASVHTALYELLQGNVDAGPGGDSEGSDGGDASDGESTETPAPAPATANKSATGEKSAGGENSSSGAGTSRSRIAPPPQPRKENAELAPMRRRNSLSTRRTREAEMRAAAQRAEAAAAAAAALLGNRPDLLSGPSLPPPRGLLPSHVVQQSRPEHPSPPPPLVQQPTVLLQQQQERQAQERQPQERQTYERHVPGHDRVHMQQQPREGHTTSHTREMQRDGQHPGLSHSAAQHNGLSGAANHANGASDRHPRELAGLQHARVPAQPSTQPSSVQPSTQPSIQPSTQPSAQASTQPPAQPVPFPPHADAEDDASCGDFGGDAELARGASFDRGRGFTGKSLSMRSTQWAARSRPVPQGARGVVPNSEAAVSGGPGTASMERAASGRPPRTPGASNGATGAPSVASPGSPAVPSAKQPLAQQPLLKRRPQLPASFAGAEGGGDDSLVCGSHTTPFAELIARRGVVEGGGSADSCSNNVEPGLVAGLELLVSHVRRANGSNELHDDVNAGGGRGGEALDGGLLTGSMSPHYGSAVFAARSKSSPVAGRRALPPSASVQAALHEPHELAEPPPNEGLSAAEVDDAIYNFAASLRASRRTRGAGGALDGGDDESFSYQAVHGAHHEVESSVAHHGLHATMPPRAP